MFNLVLYNYYSVSNFLFRLSGFLITGCNLFFILVNPYRARIDDVMLVLDTSDILLSFFVIEGVFRTAGEIEDDETRLSSSMSMKSLFFPKDVITLSNELYLLESESLVFCFLEELPSAIILKPTSCIVLILFLSFDSLFLRMPILN